jgi:hypothetical protein
LEGMEKFAPLEYFLTAAVRRWAGGSRKGDFSGAV